MLKAQVVEMREKLQTQLSCIQARSPTPSYAEIATKQSAEQRMHPFLHGHDNIKNDLNIRVACRDGAEL